LAVDDAIFKVKKAEWYRRKFKEREVEDAIKAVLQAEELP